MLVCEDIRSERWAAPAKLDLHRVSRRRPAGTRRQHSNVFHGRPANLQKPLIPVNEVRRLRALEELAILDTRPEERFDRITRLAKKVFDVPIALVSLVDRDRQWFKSRQGLDALETPRDISFCGHAILKESIFVVPDTLEDPRFADNPLVTGPPHIRFYAGRPLNSDRGERLGTLCVIDSSPRSFGVTELELLDDLGGCAESELKRTSLERTAKAIRTSEANLRAVLDTAVESIICIDDEGSILWSNPAAEQLFGHKSTDMTGKNVKMLMPEPYASEHDGYISRYLRTGEARIIGSGREVTGLRSDGSTFPMELAVSEVDTAPGERRLFTGIARDISERKETENLKNEFVSTVSHELRTPLTSIQGSLGLVLGGAAGEIPRKVRDLLEITHRNSTRLTTLINDILDIEKIASGRMNFDMRTLGLKAVAEHAVESLAGYAARHEIEIRCEFEADGIEVVADEQRLMQVFANLLSNAIKHSPRNANVLVRLVRRHRHARIEVIDQGPGIPEDFRNRIFTRFAQADSSDTRRTSGTGLGLSITKSIVETLGGDIGYDPGIVRGSCFWVELPLQSAKATGPQHLAGGVLVCEDNADVADVLRTILEAEGILADVAHTAAQARECLAAGNYRLLLLDLLLPDTSGLDLLRQLRADARFANLPVIVVSAVAEVDRHRAFGETLNVMNWIKKPFEPQRLLETLKAALAAAPRPRILHVEDDADVLQVVGGVLEDMADVTQATSLETARGLLKTGNFDLVLLDLQLGDGSSAELLPAIGSGCPIVIFSGAEAGMQESSRITASLRKATTSNEQLVEAIRGVLETGSEEDCA
ncbi:MAG: PAS domain S-box protein [Proteobacteria bacterium]|nr:MAG: PAS domain S-box protein [Pseudomonadota bacterium]